MLKVNDYFNGKVKSIAFKSGDLPATVGVMTAGEYEFDTNQQERMTVISGTLSVKLPNCSDWTAFSAGGVFTVPAHAKFHLRVAADTAYLCTYE